MLKTSNINNISSILISLLFSYAVSAQSRMDSTVNALAVIPEPANVIYAGTDQGLYISENNGRGWSSLGLTNHIIKDIHILPSNKDIIYVAAGSNGILKSTNGGDDWVKLNITLPASTTSRDVSDIRSLVTDSSNPSVLYAGSFEGYILKSTDNGKTWSIINPEFPLVALNTLALDPSAKETIYAGLGGRGVVKSSDNGVTWIDMNSGLLDKTVTQLIVDPVQSERLYAGTYGGGVFISDDNGQTWKSANTGLTDTFIYSLALSRSTMDSANTGGLFNRIKQKVANLVGNSAAELLVGVFGGDLFRGSGSDEIHWQPLAAK